MKPFTTFAIVVFAVVALIQATRFALGWPVSVNGIEIPVWASAIAALIAAGLAVMLWREMRGPPR